MSANNYSIISPSKKTFPQSTLTVKFSFNVLKNEIYGKHFQPKIDKKVHTKYFKNLHYKNVSFRDDFLNVLIRKFWNIRIFAYLL